MYTHEPTYRDAIKHAWHVVWHHKVLWIFGMLSVFIGQFGLGDFLGKLLVMSKNIFGPNGQYGLQMVVYGQQSFSISQILGTLALFVLALTLFILVIFVSVTSQGALVASAISWFKDKKINFKQAWDIGVKHFWNVLAINVLQKLFLGALLFLVLFLWIGLVPMVGSGFGTELMGIGFGFALFFAFIISSVAIYAIGYVVNEDLHILPAMRKGWRLFSHHVLVSIELNLLVLILGLVLLVVLSFGAVVVFLPSLLFWLLGIVFSSVWLIKFGFTLGFGLLLMLLIFTGSIFNSFSTSAWMYLFLKMHHEGVLSRCYIGIHRLFGKK